MYNNNNNYYDYNPQQHNTGYGGHDAYAMNDMTPQQQQGYPYYEETKPIPEKDGYYRASQNDTEKYARRNNQGRSCCDTICCGCCTCCPRWCRWLSCIILLIIIAFGIAVGVLAALFKMPTVDSEGVQGTPTFGLVGTNVNLNMSLGFVVNNPNIESVTFKTLTATANYHGDTTTLGGGTLNNLHIADHSVTDIDFPFNMSLDITNNATFTVLQLILNDCNTGTDIPLDYKIVATVSIIGIPISIPYSNTISVKCPLDSSGTSTMVAEIGQLLSSLLGGATGGNIGGTIASVLDGGSLPTSVPSGISIPSGVSIPSSIPTDLAGLTGAS